MIHSIIILDNQLVDRARELTGIKSKREVVDHALRKLIQIEEQTKIKELRRKLRWEGNIDDLRKNRHHDSG